MPNVVILRWSVTVRGIICLLAAMLLSVTPARGQTPEPAGTTPANRVAVDAAAANPPAAGKATQQGAPPSKVNGADGPQSQAGDGSAPAAPTASERAQGGGADTRSLDQEVQGLKQDAVDLNRDLFVLEEELLFPANTQVAVFLSMDVGEFFALDAVTLKIDGKEVINYLYTPREVEALLKGGVQRLYVGNVKVGRHELVAFFSGKGPNERDYKRGAMLRFDKGIGAHYLELKVNDRQRRLQPEFEIKDWE